MDSLQKFPYGPSVSVSREAQESIWYLTGAQGVLVGLKTVISYKGKLQRKWTSGSLAQMCELNAGFNWA